MTFRILSENPSAQGNMKTKQELVAISKTDDGKRQINNMVADLCGVERMTACWMSSYKDPDNIGCRFMAEPIYFPDYSASLDAIIPVVREMGDELWDDYLFHLEALCGTDGWQIMGLNERWSIATAEAVQHCIAFILTRQQITTDKI